MDQVAGKLQPKTFRFQFEIDGLTDRTRDELFWYLVGWAERGEDNSFNGAVDDFTMSGIVEDEAHRLYEHLAQWIADLGMVMRTSEIAEVVDGEE